MPSPSQVLICNLGLAAIGTRSTIASINEASAEARACLLQYDQALDDILSAAHWNFARKQAALTLLKDATASPPDSVPAPWLYSYAYPSDCVMCRYVMPLFADGGAAVSLYGVNPGTSYSQIRTVRFIVSLDTDDDGNPVKVILTNQPAATLVYTMRLTDPTLYDGGMIRAFGNYLGALLSIPLSGDKALARMAFELADRTTKAARASNGNEGITVNDVIPDWILARGIEQVVDSDFYMLSPIDLSFVT